MSEPQTPGPLESARGVLTTLLDILRTRMQLLGLDLEEQAARLLQAFILAIAAACLLVMGVASAALLITLWLWEIHRGLAAAFVVLFLLGGAALCAAWCMRRLRQGPRPFEATLAELDKDLERLRGKP